VRTNQHLGCSPRAEPRERLPRTANAKIIPRKGRIDFKIAVELFGKLDLSLSPAPHLERSPVGDKNSYAAFFFPAFSFAHRARCAAAIFLRADADMVRFTGADAVVFVFAGFDPLRAFDHLAF
jgi:hypothetical protein